MKQFFSLNLYRQGLRKVRNVGIAMAIVIIAFNALIPIFILVEEALWHSQTVIGHNVTPVETAPFAPFGIAVIVFAPLMVYSMFSFLNERKSSDFYHAIPHKRACVYISFLSAVMTWIVGILLTSALINSILWTATREFTMSWESFALSLVNYIVIALVMAGFMALAMMLTGTVISNCLVFLLLLLFVRALGFFFLYCLNEVAPMFVSETSWLRIFELRFFMPFEVLFEGVFEMDEDVFRQAGMIVYWLIVGILLLVAAGVFYHFRRSENATKSAPSRLLQHIFRIAVTLPFMLLGIVFIALEGGFEVYHIIFFVLAIVVYALYELLTTKKLRSLVRALPLVFVPVVLSFVFLGAVYTAKGIIYSTVPSHDQIESVALMGNTYNTDYESIATYGVFVDDQAILNATAEALLDSKEWKGARFSSTITAYPDNSNPITYYSEEILIKLKSGREKAYRVYSVHNLHAMIMNTEECRGAYLALPSEDEINYLYYYSPYESGDDGSTKPLWQSFKAEYEALSDAQKLAYKNGLANGDDYLEFYINGTYLGIPFHSNYYVYEEYMPKTAALYRDHCNAKNDPLEQLRKLQDILTDTNQEYQYGNISFVQMDNGKRIHLSGLERLKDTLESLQLGEHLVDFDSGKKVYSCTIEYYVLQSYGKGDMTEENVFVSEYGNTAFFFLSLTDEEFAALYMLSQANY